MLVFVIFAREAGRKFDEQETEEHQDRKDGHVDYDGLLISFPNFRYL